MVDSRRHRIAPQVRQRAGELRRPQTPAEQLLWQHLRGRQLQGFYFRRQHPIGRFIVDFCCTRRRLIVELDGDVHVGQEEYDSARTDWLQCGGYQVIRFTNDDVFHHLNAVLEDILAACKDQADNAVDDDER